MQIIFSDKENEYNVNFNNNCVMFGSNNSGKTKTLKVLADSLKNGNAIVNSLKRQKNEYDVIFFSEEADFNDEFSFTKSNLFRSTIYDSIMSSINKDQLLKEVNSTVGVPCKILVMFSFSTHWLTQWYVGVPCKILVMFSFKNANGQYEALEYPAKF